MTDILLLLFRAGQNAEKKQPCRFDVVIKGLGQLSVKNSNPKLMQIIGILYITVSSFMFVFICPLHSRKRFLTDCRNGVDKINKN